MIILGLNAYHGDSSACLVKDGNLIAAAEEERFNRVKHWSGFPKEAIRYCLKEGKVDINDIDYIAINRNPRANILRKGVFVFKKRPSIKLIVDRIKNARRWQNIKNEFLYRFNKASLKPKIYHIEHHLAHLASSFLISPFKESALISVDGFGDFVSTMLAVGQDNSIRVLGKVYFPHSLGVFYQAITQYLGFKNYGDEYKVMGLAPCGEPNYVKEMQDIVRLKENGLFELNLDYFRHPKEELNYSWDNCAPSVESLYTDKLVEILGPERNKNDRIEKRHKDVAQSLQTMYEKVFFHILDYLYKKANIKNLCIAGGCGMNSAANGKVYEKSSFRQVYIPAAAGDGGGAIGTAYYLHNNILRNNRNYIMDNVYFGPCYSNTEIDELVIGYQNEIERRGYLIKRIEDEEILCKNIANYIANGKIIGWFQGRMEWGPRALGNRSIVCDPRRKNMKAILNARIKRREFFRPFAPSILREYVREYFETDCDVPFMSQVFEIKKEKREVLPAVTHVDGSGRLQTVTKEQNPRYYRLIDEFRKITGVPVVLNTSFNENEPIVNTPEEALNCFLRTKMDVLVLNNSVIIRGKI